MKRIVCIVGYNNTRINDVKIISNIIRNKHNAYSMLIKDVIDEKDKEVVDYTLESDLISTCTKKIDDFLNIHQLELIGVLPFSDRGVILGSALAESKNLIHDLSNDFAEASVHKNKFRELEKKASVPEWYKKVNSVIINNFEDALEFLHKNNKMFIKPTSEGNSRGCMAVYNESDLQEWDKQFSHYYNDGVICEDLIDGQHEYSYDNVSKLEWITEKKTTEGLYRAEYNHVSPPKLEKDKYDLLIQAGRLVKQMIGANDLACHIELFLNKDGTISCVEPNRRPAGGKVFSIGNHLFNLPKDITVWDLWIDRAIGKNDYYKPFSSNSQSVGFRFLRSFNNIKVSIDKNIVEEYIINKYKEYIKDIQLTFERNQQLSNKLKTNAEFIGQVLITNDNYIDLNNILDNIEKDINELIINGQL